MGVWNGGVVDEAFGLGMLEFNEGFADISRHGCVNVTVGDDAGVDLEVTLFRLGDVRNVEAVQG